MPGNQPAKFHKFTRTFSPSQKTIGNPFTDYFFTTPSRSLFLAMFPTYSKCPHCPVPNRCSIF